MVCSGDSDVIGSWKMIEIRPPRIARISLLSGAIVAMSTVPDGARPPSTAAVSFAGRGLVNRISPPVMAPFRGRMPMIA